MSSGMAELDETINEAIERAHQGHHHPAGPPAEHGHAPPSSARWTLNSVVAISVAVTATFTALCNVKKGSVELVMARAQANAIDSWAYYQAKGTKLNIAEAALDSLRVERATMPGLTAQSRAFIDQKLGEYVDKVRKYDSEKAEIKYKAEELQESIERMDVRVDRFDLAEALTSIAVALFGITALTQKQRLLIAAWVFAAAGLVAGVVGFLGIGPLFKLAGGG
jgi:uncharacterized protein DUF4337